MYVAAKVYNEKGLALNKENCDCLREEKTIGLGLVFSTALLSSRIIVGMKQTVM